MQKFGSQGFTPWVGAWSTLQKFTAPSLVPCELWGDNLWPCLLGLGMWSCGQSQEPSLRVYVYYCTKLFAPSQMVQDGLKTLK